MMSGVIKKISLLLGLCCASLFCSSSMDIDSSSMDMFGKLEKELHAKFGGDSYFTDVEIYQNSDKKLEVNLLSTANPYALEMEGWTYKNEVWTKISQVELELPKGDIINYLYTFKGRINLVKLGGLIDSSIAKIIAKGYKDVYLNKAFITSPDSGHKSQIAYVIQLFSNDKTINYKYNLEGHLVKEEII